MKFAITSRMLDQMAFLAESSLPEEACGILGGRSGTGLCVIGVENELHSSQGFRMKPQEQLRAFTTIEDAGLDMSGIFHSHPSGPDHPSETDIAQAYYPELVNLILWRSEGHWKCGAFQIDQNGYRSVELVIISE